MDLSIADGHPFLSSIFDTFLENDLDTNDEGIWNAFRIGSEFAKEPELPTIKTVKLPALTLTHFHLSDESAELPGLDQSEVSTAPSINEVAPVDQDAEKGETALENLWELPEVFSSTRQNKLLSWDTFTIAGFEEPRSAYLSEAGKSGYDLVLRLRDIEIQKSAPKVSIRQNLLCAALVELGLGRQSILFRYNEETLDFECQVEEFMLSGFSREMVDAVVFDIKTHGLLLLAIRRTLPAEARQSTLLKTQVAFKSAVSTVLLEVENLIEEKGIGVQSLLELTQIFNASLGLLVQLRDLTGGVSKHSSDSSLVSEIVSYLEEHVAKEKWTERIMNEIASRTGKPWLIDLFQRVGLKPGDVYQLGFNLTEGTNASDGIDTQAEDDELSKLVAPLSVDCQNTFIDCASGLQLLQTSQPDHPLVSQRFARHRPLWETDWDGLRNIQARANSYATTLKVAIEEYQRDGLDGGLVDHTHDTSKVMEATSAYTGDLKLENLSAGDRLGHHLVPVSSEPTIDRLALLFRSGERNPHENERIEPLPQDSLEMSVWPLLSIQDRMVQDACLRLLFKDLKLRSHISFLQHFYMLGSGDFVSRLATALFDPNLSSGERSSARSRSTYRTGLRLQSRDSWPPATSELRLVLMGVLADSYQVMHLARNINSTRHEDVAGLPGDLSFSIRDLSDAELELCRDADGIEALDFLCINYRPNHALGKIISQRSLRRYDQVFKHLLRLLRVHQVTQAMVREVAGRRLSRLHDRTNRNDVVKLCMEMHHFVTALYEFATTVAIDKHWHALQNYLDQIEQTLECDSTDVPSPMLETIDAIRQRHEHTLDRIVQSLYLSKKYQQVKNLIDDVLRVILKSSSALRTRPLPTSGPNTSMYFEEFVGLVKKLLAFLEKRTIATIPLSNSNRDHAEDANNDLMAEQLLMRLDFFNYYQDTPIRV